MDIYKLNQRKQRFHSPGYQGSYGREAHKPYNHISQPPAIRLLRSPAQFFSAPVMGVSPEVRVYDVYQGFVKENDVPTALGAINESKLGSVVRKSLHRDNFCIQGWRARKLDGDAGNLVSQGLYRFEGVGVDRSEWLDWSIVLKIIQSPANQGYVDIGEGDDQTHWNYWKRELLVYQSGWLESLPEGITAPRCIETVELPGNVAGLWLEDIIDSFLGTWPLYRYALAARHLGRLNGIYISRRQLPSYPWLSLQRTRQWLNSVHWQDFPWEHPRVRQQFPNPQVNSFRRFLQDHERYLAQLDLLPKTISHGDTYPTNFKSRRLNHGQEQTVAMDWAYSGIEPLGDDLGQLVYGTYLNLRAYKLQDISNTLFTSYVNGLEDSGCRIDPTWVRFGYTASAAFRVGLFKLVVLRNQLNNGEELVDSLVNPQLETDLFESFMADEATQLLDSM